MPAIGGPNITEDGLVFAYDLGNVRSYKGEPTTNFMPPIYKAGSNITSGTDSIGDYFEGTITRIGCPNVTRIDSGTTYTLTIEIRADQTFNMSADSNQYAPENAGNDNNRVSVSYILPNYTTPGKWVKYSTTVVMKSGLTNPYMFDFFIPISFTGRMYYRNAQLEYKPHATQFTPTGTTRSSTQGLIDLTGNSTIDLTNVGFDSNAEVDFDGTSDYINLGDNTIWDFGINGTLEMVLKPKGSTGNNRLWCIDNNPSNLDAYLNSSGYNVYMHGGRVGTSTPLIPNQWNHLIVTYNNGTIQMYVNGVEGIMNGATTGYNISNNSGNNNNMYIGRYRTSGYNFNGSIPIFKVYNRALTSEEIQANFNAIKGRFNI